MIHDRYTRQVVVAETVRRLLDLRETLVRFDENLAAWHLLSRAVPFFAVDHPAIAQARDEQYLMVRHVLPADELRDEDRGRDPYESYYATNPHERPFEEQYGIGVDQAHRIPRVQFMLAGLKDQVETGKTTSADLKVVDLSANDGWMAARLALNCYPCDCLDLHPGNVELARKRAAEHEAMGRVEQGALEEAPTVFCGSRWMNDDPGRLDDPYWSWAPDERRYDAVVGFETIEHVRDPRAMLNAMRACCKPGGALYLSTPNGAVEGGNLPTWATVEPKGHVRVYTAESFRALLAEYGTVDRFELGADGVLCARVRPG